MTDKSSSLLLLRSGSMMLLTGLFVGLTISSVPYPRLALAAHKQFVMEGIMSMVAGLILDKVPMKRRLHETLVVYGHIGLWLQCGSELLAAFTGAFDTLTIATQEAGVSEDGKNDMAEIMIQLLHAIPGTALIISWGILSWSIYQATSSQKMSDNKKK